MKSLRDIKTSCGRRKIQSAVDRSHSFVGARQQKQQPQKQQPYKARTIKSSPTIKIGVQKSHEFILELSQENDDINIQIPLPQTIAKSIQLNLYGDILIIQSEESYIECLLPFEVQSSINRSYGNGILHINLKRK